MGIWQESHELKNQCQTKGFTIIELIVVIIVLALLNFGFISGVKIGSHYNSLVGAVAGISFGSLLVLVFVVSCMGIGHFLDKRRNRSEAK